MEIAKRGRVALTVCSNAFVSLGRAQQSALGAPDLPIAVVPHPFGTRKRDELRTIAEQCVAEIARLACEGQAGSAASEAPAIPRAALVEAPGDLEALNDFYMERRWGDGLLIVPPTRASFPSSAACRAGSPSATSTARPRGSAAARCTASASARR